MTEKDYVPTFTAADLEAAIVRHVTLYDFILASTGSYARAIEAVIAAMEEEENEAKS